MSDAQSETDNGQRVRASINGNGHKTPSVHEVVVEINGHKTAHPVPETGATDNASPVAEQPDAGASVSALPAINENGKGHAEMVTSPHGEGTPAIERQLDYSDAEAGDEGDEEPHVVHEIRVDAATNGREETISIQIGIHLQSKALKMKRWEVKDEPFEGFKSPPGRF